MVNEHNAILLKVISVKFENTNRIQGQRLGEG